MLILEWTIVGFFSAIGWWSANHYVIEPHFPPAITTEKKDETGN
jgi:hypothetical protein